MKTPNSKKHHHKRTNSSDRNKNSIRRHWIHKLAKFEILVYTTSITIILTVSLSTFLEYHKLENKRKSENWFLKQKITPPMNVIEQEISDFENKVFREEQVSYFKNSVSILSRNINRIKFSDGMIILNADNKKLIPEIRRASLDVIRYSRDIERIIRNDPRYKKILEPTMLELSVISGSSNWAQIKENFGKDLIGAISVLK